MVPAGASLLASADGLADDALGDAAAEDSAADASADVAPALGVVVDESALHAASATAPPDRATRPAARSTVRRPQQVVEVAGGRATLGAASPRRWGSAWSST